MATFHRKDSFLKSTKILDGLFLNINKLPKVPASIYDEDYKIEQRYDQRPDWLAYVLYGNERLWWVFALRNLDEIRDPIRDFRAGTTIKLPSAEAVAKIVGV
jgi:hypothetical protein